MNEVKEFYSMDEATEAVGCKRASLYNYMRALGITTRKFKYDKRHFLTANDVARLRELKEKPWMAGEGKASDPAA